MDAVQIFEEALNKKIDVQFVPAEGLQSQLDSAKDPMQKSFTALMLCVANGDFIDMKAVLEKFPVRLTSVNEFAKQMVQALVV